MTAEQRPRVFISYSRVDSEFAYRLRADLEASGFPTWMDPNLGSEGGQNWVRMIQEAIEGCQAMVVIVSPDSAASEWVQIEYSYIRKQPGKLLVPVHVRTTEPFPIDLGNKERIEFRDDQGGKDWYQTGFTNLVRSLAKAPKLPKLAPIPKAPDQPPRATTEAQWRRCCGISQNRAFNFRVQP